MIELIETVTSLPVADIREERRLRPVSAAAVAVLRDVIAEHGFTVPVLVRQMRDRVVLIDGAHRMAAMRELGRADIPVRLVRCLDDEAATLETTQNLAGASMSPLDDAVFLAAYADAYQKLHPETKRGLAGALAKNGSATELSSFAEVIAEKRAISVRQVRKITKVGRMLQADEVNALRATMVPMTLKDLEVLAKAKPDERVAIVQYLAEGEVRKASDALKRHRAANGEIAPVKSAEDQQYLALLSAFSRASKSALRRFVSDQFDALTPLLADEAERRAKVAFGKVAFGEIAAQ